MKPVPGLIPGTDGDIDQVVRWQKFMDEHPTAEKQIIPPSWTGSIVVRGKRRRIARTSLKSIIDGLQELAGMEADALAIEADFPGWRVWLSDLMLWYASRADGSGEDPATACGDDAAGLRAALAAVPAPAPR